MNLPLYTIGFWELGWSLLAVFGLPLAVAIRRRMDLPLYFLPILTSIVFGVYGYGLFLSAVWWHPLVFISAAAFVSCCCCWWNYQNHNALQDCLNADSRYPFLIALLATLLYPMLYFARLTPPYAVSASLLHNHIIVGMPIDAVLQFLLNESLLAHMPLDQGAFAILGSPGGWGHGDRPPLLAGETLFATCLFDTIEGRLMAYQTLGSICQATIFFSGWATLRAMGVPIAKAITAIVFFVFTGFAFFHTSFLWSKLQGAAFVGAAVSLILSNRRSPATYALLAVCYALAMLSHGSVVFSLVPLFALTLGRCRTMMEAAHHASAVALAVLMYVPWILFQKFVAPPGDNLVKYFLAGATTLNDGRSLGEALRDCYSALTWADVLRIRMENLGMFFWRSDMTLGRGVADVQSVSFFHVVPALGALILPIALRWQTIFRDKLVNEGEFDGRMPPTVKSGLRLCLTLFLATTMLWVAVMYSPREAVIHQGSLFNTWLLFAVSLVLLAYAPPRFQWQVGVIHIAVFVALWIVPLPGSAYRYTPIAVLVAAACTSGFAYLMWTASVLDRPNMALDDYSSVSDPTAAHGSTVNTPVVANPSSQEGVVGLHRSQAQLETPLYKPSHLENT
jgi:hypothetical protein